MVTIFLIGNHVSRYDGQEREREWGGGMRCSTHAPVTITLWSVF